MEHYDALVGPGEKAWLELDEGERIELVTQYHVSIGEQLPDFRQNLLHATMHVIVENQLALEVLPVCHALERLLREGLDRHDAIHAIASVLAGRLYDIAANAAGDASERYAEELHQLTAKSWRATK